MIELFSQREKTIERQSSKGNQLKWENEGIWYKADYTGYEGLSEYMVSHLLLKSTLQAEELVIYDLEQMYYETQVYDGVKSNTFLPQHWQLITLERLFKSFCGKSLYQMLFRITDVAERLKFLVDYTERITGLKDFGSYMNKVLTIDAFFLNEDRHTHNIAVLMDADGKFAYCPLFDHGAGLLADTTLEYPMNQDVYSLMNKVKAKTICQSFDEQLDLSEELYGRHIRFHFDKKDVDELLEDAQQYAPKIRERVRSILYMQMEKYRYLFTSEEH